MSLFAVVDFWRVFNEAGILAWILLAASVVAVFIIVERAIALRRDAVIPAFLTEAVLQNKPSGGGTQSVLGRVIHFADRLFHVSIIPFHSTPAGALPQSAMLVLEDFTQIEAAKQLEIEASKARLIALIAKRFAHEIRNSLVPLATHEQLLDTEYQDDDFRRSLKTALARETSRIGRFTEQMLYLAQPPRTPGETINLRDVVQHCFDRVSGSQAPAGKLQLRSDADIPLVRCHRPALEHAVQEVLTNALQARPEEPVVHVSISRASEDTLLLTVRDNGPGFSEDTSQHALEPFYTTRNTGVGLGLTVARKIVEDHHGRLELAMRSAGHEHDVSITLPAAQL